MANPLLFFHKNHQYLACSPNKNLKKKKKKITHKNLQLGSLYYSWSIQTNIFKTTCHSLKRFLESPTTFEQKHPWSQEFTYAQCSFEAVGKWQILFVCLKKHVDKWRVKVFCSPISLALLPGWNEVVYYKLQGYLSLPSMKSLLDKPGYTIISWMHHIYPYPSFKECYSCYMSIMSQLSWEAGGECSSSLLEASFCFNIISLNLPTTTPSILQAILKDVHP